MSEIIVNFVYNNIEYKLNAKKEELMKNLSYLASKFLNIIISKLCFKNQQRL